MNSGVEIVPIVADVHAGNLEDLLKPRFDLILDGMDNVQTRYLVNDASVKHDIPWVYGAVVGVEGRVMGIVPQVTPCLRCVFPMPPSPHELPACDTAGVLGMAASIVGAYQAIDGIKILTRGIASNALMRFDFWTPRTHVVSTLDAKRADCRCCGLRDFESLDAAPGESAVTLCGRNAVQVRPTGQIELSLDRLEQKLRTVGTIQRTPYFLRCRLADPAGVSFTIFPDGRSLIHGVNDLFIGS